MGTVKLTSKIVISFSLILLIAYSVFFLKRIQFDNEVIFSGDVWEYQSMAVNFVKGRGLMKTGGIIGDYHQGYKFRKEIDKVYEPTLELFEKTGKAGGKYNFYRTPGYTIFMGTIYKFFGISPEIVKKIQLLLIIAIAAFLPFVGFNYWKKSGFIAGFMGGIVYLNQYARNMLGDSGITYPNHIMSETLLAFTLFLLVMVFIFWERQKNPTRTFILGLMIGLTLLVKGTNVFIPLIVFIYLWYLIIKKTVSKLNLAMFILGVVITVLPWSYYASKISGRTIILSTQTTVALLDNNNEYADDGSWHPEGYSYNQDAFYNQPEIKPLSLPAKLMAFYVAYPQMFPNIFLAKIRLGFEGNIYLKMSLMLIGFSLISQSVLSLLKKFGIKIYFKITAVMSLFMSLLLVDVFKSQAFLFNFTMPFLQINILLFGLILIIILTTLIDKKNFKIDLPTSFVILFLNYLLVTVVTVGLPRLTQAIDFVFILVFFQYLLSFITELYHGVTKRVY